MEILGKGGVLWWGRGRGEDGERLKRVVSMERSEYLLKEEN